MGKLMRAQLRAMLHSRFCLLFLGVALLLSILLFFDNGDVKGSPRELEEQVEQIGFDGMKRINQAEGAESIEEIMALLRTRQVIAAPGVAAGGMLLLLFLLPGVTLAPALTRTLGIQRELRRRAVFGLFPAVFRLFCTHPMIPIHILFYLFQILTSIFRKNLRKAFFQKHSLAQHNFLISNFTLRARRRLMNHNSRIW